MLIDQTVQECSIARAVRSSRLIVHVVFVAIPLSGKRVERVRPAAAEDLPGKSFGGDIRDVKC